MFEVWNFYFPQIVNNLKSPTFLSPFYFVGENDMQRNGIESGKKKERCRTDEKTKMTQMSHCKSEKGKWLFLILTRILFIRDIHQNPTSYKSSNSEKYFRKKSRQEKSKMNPDLLKCPVCMEIFDGKVFILKCGHNLCSICLPKLIQQQVRVTIARSLKIENPSVSKILRYDSNHMIFTVSDPMWRLWSFWQRWWGSWSHASIRRVFRFRLEIVV